MLYQPKALPPLTAVYTGLAALGLQEGVVYGGCLYDTDMGKPFNDIDVVAVRPEGRSPAESAAIFARSLDAGMTVTGQFGDRFKIRQASGPEIDLSFTHQTDAVSRAHAASVGLAGIAFSIRHQAVFIGMNYLGDRDNRQLSLLDPEQLPYARKLQGKYPDFPIVSPQGRRILYPAGAV